MRNLIIGEIVEKLSFVEANIITGLKGDVDRTKSLVFLLKEMEKDKEDLRIIFWEIYSTFPSKKIILESLSVEVKTGVFFFVLETLVKNSRGAREIKISSKIEGSNLLVIYEDDGISVPSDHKEKVFSKRGMPEMFIVKMLIEDMGGTIVENGIPRKGTRFVISIPSDRWSIL